MVTDGYSVKGADFKIPLKAKWEDPGISILSLSNNILVFSAFSPFPKMFSKGRILDLAKLKAFAGNKINMTKTLKFDFGRVENIVEKGENPGYQHFLLFPQHFQKVSF